MTCACGQPVNDAYLCRDCTQQLTIDLLVAATMGHELDTARSRQARFSAHNGHGSFSHPLPYDVRAAEAADQLAMVLAAAVHTIGHREPLPPVVITTMAVWLLRHTSRIRQHGLAATIAGDISTVTMRAQRTIDRPPSRIYAGPCPACGEDLLGQPGHATIICRNCGQPSIVAERREAMRQALEDHLGDATYAARVCTGLGIPVTPERVRQWVHRGKLARHGGLLRIGDVITIALDQRARLAQRG